MTSAQLVPALVVPLIVWRVYRRVRKNVGRQLFHRGRLVATMVIFGLLVVVFALTALRSPVVEEGLGAGIVVGALLAWVGLRLTRFDFTTAGHYYTPNTIIGVAVTMLLVGRIVYRVLVLRTAMEGAAWPPQASMFQSPLTLVIFGITAGYYIVYAAGVLTRANKLTASLPASTPPAS